MGAPEHITNKYTDTIKQESYSHAECHKDLIFQLHLGYQKCSYVQGNELRKCCQSTYQIRNHLIKCFWFKGYIFNNNNMEHTENINVSYSMRICFTHSFLCYIKGKLLLKRQLIIIHWAFFYFQLQAQKEGKSLCHT